MRIVERRIFFGSNTPDGFVGWFDGIVDNYGLRKLYILKGGSGVGKATFIGGFANAFIEKARAENACLTVEYLMCSADPTSLDGVILHEFGIAMIDGTHPHIVDPKYPGIIDEIVDLGQFIGQISATQEELFEIKQKRKECFARAFEELERARVLHMQIEDRYRAVMDWDGINKLLAQLISIENERVDRARGAGV